MSDLPLDSHESDDDRPENTLTGGDWERRANDYWRSWHNSARISGDQQIRAEALHDALWRCYELTGADTSDGPWPEWERDAIEEVARLRKEHDAAEDRLEAAMSVEAVERAARAIHKTMAAGGMEWEGTVWQHEYRAAARAALAAALGEGSE